jgi:pSer/pThr/pTyr-binding forkhead associated (FHA) protein
MASAPIGVLRCTDGPTVPLDRSYVVGRDPQNDPSVRAGQATPITVSDPTNLISRVHAFVSVDDGVVVVRDGSTVSGTYLAEPGAEGWTRITTRPTEIPPGWHLRIGTKIFVFEPTLPPAS